MRCYPCSLGYCANSAVYWARIGRKVARLPNRKSFGICKNCWDDLVARASFDWTIKCTYCGHKNLAKSIGNGRYICIKCMDEVDGRFRSMFVNDCL